MISRNFRVTSAFALFASMMLAIAGCGAAGSTATATSQVKGKIVTIAAVPSADLAGVYIAQDDGFFAKEGLQVKLVSVPSSRAIIAAQSAGKIDLSAGAYTPYIPAQAAGQKFHILAEGSIMTTGTRLLLVPRGSSLTKVSQLAGKTIGMNATNSIGTLLVRAMLAQNGVNPDSVRLVTDQQGFKTMAAKLASGAWDAAFFGEPFGTQAEEQYGETPILDLDQGATSSLPVSGYIVTQSWLDKNQQTAAAFVRAIEAAQLDADSNPNVARDALAMSDALPRIVTDVMAIPGFPIGAVSFTRIQQEALDMIQFGLMDKKYTSVVDSGALVKAMIGLGSWDLLGRCGWDCICTLRLDRRN
ncbi:MAG: ABC transporter substrate-binding protein [Trebonia sp.]